MKQGYIYIITNKAKGVLYVGVTSDLIRRTYEHKHKLAEGFTKKYHLMRLVYFETHDTITAAIQREKNIKFWSRQWKIELIEGLNPEWNDLYPEITGQMPTDPGVEHQDDIVEV